MVNRKTMFESILSKTNLPNFHPALVHFPIVLFTAALAIDAILFFVPKKDWLRNTATLLFVLAGISAGITYWSGRQAADSLDVLATAQAVLSRHETLGLYTFIFLGVYALIRILARNFVSKQRWAHLIVFVVAIAGQVLITITADYGGALVYKHAVAVKLPEIPAATVATTPQSQQTETPGPTIQGKDILWTFVPGSEKKLLEFMEVVQGTLQSDQMKTETISGRTVISINQNSQQQTILVFKPVYEDVQVEADLDLSNFKGAVALVHHVSDRTFDFFRIEEGMAELGRRKDDKEVTLADKEIQNLAGIFTLKAVGASGHFRGYINGKLWVHGHHSDASPGKAGILFDGIGTVRIARIAVNHLEEEHEHMNH